MQSWEDLQYWQSGEWQVVEERLDDLDRANGGRGLYCPARENLFTGLDLCSPNTTRVCILGQDPYTNPSHATGVAFSIPGYCKEFPPSLKTIFKEYSEDLHYPSPTSGDLTPWCRQGVLLWNCIPSVSSVRPAKALSHYGWEEWWPLTEEIIRTLDKTEHVVFSAWGSIAKGFIERVSPKAEVIYVSHPSPRGNLNSRNPFSGSRVFTTINAKLCEQGLEPIDWRLQ